MKLGSRIQLQQRNCSRFTRDFSRRSTDSNSQRTAASFKPTFRRPQCKKIPPGAGGACSTRFIRADWRELRRQFPGRPAEAGNGSPFHASLFALCYPATKVGGTSRQRSGPVAQRLEQGTHNPLVPGSNPGGPICSVIGVASPLKVVNKYVRGRLKSALRGAQSILAVWTTGILPVVPRSGRRDACLPHRLEACAPALSPLF